VQVPPLFLRSSGQRDGSLWARYLNARLNPGCWVPIITVPVR
jgi:hypothetical protein